MSTLRAAAMPKRIYCIQHESSDAPAYYATRREAERAWRESVEPLSFETVDAAAQCEALEERIENQRRDIDRLTYALSTLAAFVSAEAFAKQPDAAHALEVLRAFDAGEAEDTDRRIAEWKEQAKAEGR